MELYTAVQKEIIPILLSWKGAWGKPFFGIQRMVSPSFSPAQASSSLVRRLTTSSSTSSATNIRAESAFMVGLMPFLAWE